MPKASQARQTHEPDAVPEGFASPAEAAAYMSHMAGELAAIARAFRFEDLAYLFEMAKLEAANPSGKTPEQKTA
ncbi:MAG TPA: hypothetical protein VF601_17035 [Beijerinckiaceae bacterium]|jgi:hypothetical protein